MGQFFQNHRFPNQHQHSSSFSFGSNRLPALEPGRHFLWEGQFYCSRSEAACAALMARYLGFKARDGVSIQVPIGLSRYGDMRHADFVLRNVVFEYHPVQRPHEPRYWRMLKQIPPGEREQFRQAWRYEATERYREKRRDVLNKHSSFRDYELVVTTSPEEFYHKIIYRFMKDDHRDEPWRIPSLEKVVREFRHIQHRVADLSEQRQRKRAA